MSGFMSLSGALPAPSEYELPLITAEEGRASLHEDSLAPQEPQRPSVVPLPALQQRFLDDARKKMSNPLRRVPGYARATDALSVAADNVKAAAFACTRHVAYHSSAYITGIAFASVIGLVVGGGTALIVYAGGTEKPSNGPTR